MTISGLARSLCAVAAATALTVSATPSQAQGQPDGPDFGAPTVGACSTMTAKQSAAQADRSTVVPCSQGHSAKVAGVVLLGIDNLPGSLHLETTTVPRRVCFLFGQEGPGLSEGAREACDGTFSIAQFGSTRSINASAAAAIAMHAWIRAYADLDHESAWRG